MGKALIPAFLLVVAAIVLGSTLFREQVARAATPFTNVIVGNTSTNPVPVTVQNTETNGNIKVHEQGTANVNVTNSSVAVTPPGSVSQVCKSNSAVSDSLWVVKNDLDQHSICSGDFYVTNITVAGFDSNAATIEFRYQGNVVLNLLSSPFHGSDSYQLDLTHSLHVDDVEVYCSAVNPCQFELAMLGNSTGA